MAKKKVAGTAITTMEVTQHKAIKKKARDVLEEARAINEAGVKTQAQWAAAAEFLKDIMTVKKRINDRFDPDLKKLRQATKGINEIKKEILALPEEAEELVKDPMRKYQAAMRKIREEQERRAREKAEKKAEEDRKREIAAAKKAKDKEEERRLKQEPAAAEPVVTKRPTPLTAGVSGRQAWGVRIINKMALIKAVAAGECDPNLVEPNLEALAELAGEYKDKLEIPGVQAESKEIIAAGARKGEY